MKGWQGDHCIAQGNCPQPCPFWVLTIAVLTRWAQTQGCHVSGHPAMHVSGLRGFAAGRNLAAGEVLASIPEAILISQDTALNSDLVSASSPHSKMFSPWKATSPHEPRPWQNGYCH